MTKGIHGHRAILSGLKTWAISGVCLNALAFCPAAWAQTTPSSVPTPDNGAAIEEIVVTATKRGVAENLQDVSVAITAIGKTQLQSADFRGLETIAYSAPNVQLNPIGTVKGSANFAMRGIGTNSSIPSLDPTVGVFVDGVYLGTPAGVLLDGFDLEGIELLRGPQGILFGKNVTGGAVVLRTTTPTDHRLVDLRAGVETGASYTASGVVSGPIVDGVLSGKVAGYFNDDKGWFTNQADGGKYGGSTTKIGRGALRYTPTGALEVIGRFEIGDIHADDETPAQNRALYRADTFKVAGSRNGGADIKYKNATVETNLDVGLGDGRITNILGWRKLDTNFGLDVDALPARLFEQYQIIAQHQWSNELRYAGKFGNVSVLSGLYWFDQSVDYYEQRLFGNGPAITSSTVGGGRLNATTYGAFGSLDWKLTPTITLSGGARYTRDEKAAVVAAIRPGGCDFATRVCNYEFSGKYVTTGVTPKAGLSWQPDGDTLVYANVSKGLRGGGFNIRNAAFGVAPGPFGDEKVTAYETGAKLDLADRRLRLNLALFRNEVKNMQREVNTTSPTQVIVQVIENTADAVIQGAEAEVVMRPTSRLTLNGNIGITNGEYTRVRADINRDGVINSVDLNLKIPRLVPLTWGVGADFTQPVSFGSVGLRANYNHRDASWFSDANVPGTKLSSANLLDATLTVAFARSGLSASLYGKNLLNEVTEGSITALPAAFGGVGASYAPLNKGRVIGFSLRYRLD